MTGLEHKTPLEWSAFFEFAHRVSAPLNARGHWTLGHKRTAQERELLAYFWMAAGRPKPPCWPVIVTFTRIARCRLDRGDNLPSAFKGMRDELARRIGLKNDAGPEAVWRYAQVTPASVGKPTGFYGVQVEMRCTGEVRLR